MRGQGIGSPLPAQRSGNFLSRKDQHDCNTEANWKTAPGRNAMQNCVLRYKKGLFTSHGRFLEKEGHIKLCFIADDVYLNVFNSRKLPYDVKPNVFMNLHMCVLPS
jgi:hypothetical protein